VSEAGKDRWWRRFGWQRDRAPAPEGPPPEPREQAELPPPEAREQPPVAKAEVLPSEPITENLEDGPAEAPIPESLEWIPAERPNAESLTEVPAEAPRTGWMQRLRAGLNRSSSRLRDNIATVLRRRRLDAETLEELEEALIGADLGVETAAELVQELARTRFGKEVTDLEVRSALAGSIAAILEPVALPFQLDPAHRPAVILVCGVNGTGKTTTIGKLAQQFTAGGERVLLAAGDTFRAAAIEQLEIWGRRTGCEVIKRPPGADAAGLAFDALKQAQAEAADVLMIDTAGRLHNKQALMDELAKVVRVLKKLDPEAPHETLLVLDATTGQNARAQVETFGAMVPISGLVVTKLDGTARGGVVVALARQFGLPVRALGVGERAEDLRPFEARAFAEALLGLG
jgi:fused signal recognition particle receptor